MERETIFCLAEGKLAMTNLMRQHQYGRK